jgi:hypothetical protein
VFDEDASNSLEMGEVRKVLAGLGMSISPEELIKIVADDGPGPCSLWSGLSVYHSESVSYDAFLWAHRALNRRKRRFLPRAEAEAAAEGAAARVLKTPKTESDTLDFEDFLTVRARQLAIAKAFAIAFAFSTMNRFSMARLYGRAGRLTAKNGGFRPGQCIKQLRLEIAAQEELLQLLQVRRPSRVGPPHPIGARVERRRPCTATSTAAILRLSVWVSGLGVGFGLVHTIFFFGGGGGGNFRDAGAGG